MRLATGLYEQVINRLLAGVLDAAPPNAYHVEDRPLDPGDSHSVLSQYLEGVIRDALSSIDSDDRVARQVALCNRLVRVLIEEVGDAEAQGLDVDAPARRLMALVERTASGEVVPERPETPLSIGCLLTGTRVDPSLVSQLAKEFRSALHVDVLCSFIKWSGIRILESELREFTARPGARLRVITTSYMGATDLKAIDFLQALPNTELRVSYDTQRTRLHAKAYAFHRATGFGTAYVGSANLSRPALTEGLEWNVKVSQYESPHLWQKVTATFESYWEDREFAPYGPEHRQRLSDALERERGQAGQDGAMPFFDLVPYPFQGEILQQLEAERAVQGRNRHLVVAATGTGKTMVAAFDYRNWCRGQTPAGGPRPRLLFVAHREEILKQSLATFRAVLRDQNFGDLLVGGRRPESLDHLFVSVQSYGSRELHNLPSDYYDYVVVDEFHHAAAGSYQELLDHVGPRVLLGLTATPERADGLDVLKHFGGHVSCEIRLPDAVNRKLLSPFQYFGVSDPVDLSGLRWQRGGYRTEELDSVYTGNDVRARLVVEALFKTVVDVRRCRALAFCVSQAHAHYMAEHFRRHGVPAEALTAESDATARNTVQQRLRERQINVICVVDLYNEGVDIPEVDTVLFLRPTESLTVFLQQLGRGLRLHDEKECLTVLDFIGAQHRQFRFADRFKALIVDPSRSIRSEVEQGFSHLPAGCTIRLERVARQHVLENITRSLRGGGNRLARELAEYAAVLGRTPTMSEFLGHLHLETYHVYRPSWSWSRVRRAAGLHPETAEPDEDRLTAGLRRMQHVDDPALIVRLLGWLRETVPLPTDAPTAEAERRRLLMLHFTLWGRESGITSLAESIARLHTNPAHVAELIELLEFKLTRVHSVAPTLALAFVCPLTLHASYTRDEVLTALGVWRLDAQRELREGVLHVPEIAADVFLFTLNKTEKDYSPTTMYQDYAISESLMHWQSQSTTSPESKTGTRYANHRALGHTILLFARENKDEHGLAAPYQFLGPADYVSHEGSRPMSVIWRLHRPLPDRLLRRFARLAI
jgi:superfamily II DNA or RNA helicase/HKD family nuclease